MGKPSLLIISFSTIVSDARVLKQVALFRDAYDVITCGYGDIPTGAVEHIQIPDELIYWKKNRKHLILRRYQRAYDENEVIRFLKPLLTNRTFDIVLANDIDSVPLSLELKSKAGVHADLHEYSPRQGYDRLRWRIFVAPYMSWLVRKHVTRADSVTTVAPGIAAQYKSKFGIRVEVVKNATPFHDLQPRESGRPLKLIHSGAAIRERQLETMIDAMIGIDPSLARLDFYLTKVDEAYLNELRERARTIPGVSINDPVPYSQLITVLHESDIGVHILAPTNFNNLHALPNKLFDFVQARMGVIVGPSPEMAREVQEHGFGYVLEDFSSVSLKKTIAALSPEKVDALKMAAHAAAPALSAEKQSAAWLEAINKLADRL